MPGGLLRKDATLTLDRVCEICGVSADVVSAYVEEGLADVEGADAASWRFSEAGILHIRKALRLEKDLGLNPAGAVLVLELVEHIESLERRLRRFET
ncbi:MAG: chaperone modulator CbpM [Paracoccaceae bacterium]